MDIHHLRIFASVYKNKSFSRASEQLNISQPTISEHIKNLEAELGCALFDRLGRSILPTREAELMYPRAIHIVEETGRLKDAVASSSETVKGEMVIGASTIPGSYILPGLCHAFREQNPEVSFRVLIEDSRRITDMVLEHETVLGVVGSAMEPGRINYEPFYKDELVLASSPDMGLKGTIGHRELKKIPFILREEGSGTRSTLEGHLKKHGLGAGDLDVAAVLGSTDAVKQAVKAALGASVLSRIAVQDELDAGTLRETKVRSLKMTRSFYLASHRKRVLPAPYRAFSDFIRSQ
jgi:DNA-binding transcriptional LysR family regulator